MSRFCRIISSKISCNKNGIIKILSIISFLLSLFIFETGASQIITQTYDTSAFLNEDHALFLQTG